MSGEDGPRRLRVAVVGPCVSGKSTLAQALSTAGYEGRAVSQEHSYVPAMWQKITQPDVLIYLDVDYTHALERRPHITWGESRLEEQAKRLAHARAHCDLYVNTNGLSAEEVQRRVLTFLQEYSASPEATLS